MAFNTANFARMPESKIGHSLFKRPHTHAGTMMHGDIVPVYCRLVSPGEVIKEHIIGNIRMSTPIAPMYSSIKVSFNAFFVPLRLVWGHTKEFFGENTTSAGVQTTPYKIPKASFNRGNSDTNIKVHSVAHYLGFPLYKGTSLDSGTVEMKESVLKLRSYWLCVSEWYRQEQVMNPVLLDTSDNGSKIGSLNGSQIALNASCMKCLKDFDYFTTGTRAPQFGPEVSLPLGTTAPLLVSLPQGGLSGHAVFGKSFAQVDGATQVTPDGAGRFTVDYVESDGTVTNSIGDTSKRVDLYADLRNATAATIDELYLAMAAQAWYHNSNYGNKYFEMLQIHYSVTNPDLVLQRPEHIGEAKRYIQVQQVLSTAGAASDSSTKLGQPGANSSTQIDVSFPRHSFGEWGYFIILANTYHERYYTAGIAREDLYEDMFDFFFPEFSNIGDQTILRNEIFAASSLNQDTIFAYQEAWSEMRYANNRLSGLFDPYVTSSNGITGYSAPLAGWVLSEKWDSAPQLDSSFLLEDRRAIQDALVTGENGPDYLFYFYFDEKTLSEVPVYSVPGLPGRGRGIL